MLAQEIPTQGELYHKMAHLAWQNISVVAVATLASRVLGLIRDTLTALFLGLSPAANAFLFAFAVPNLFRRLLGEGALSSALVPVLAGEADSDQGRSAAFRLVNQAASRGGVLMVGAAVLLGAGYVMSAAVAPTAGTSVLADQWQLGFYLGGWMVPYLVLVCQAALLGAALNVLGRYAVAALSAVWLNLALILALLIGAWWAGASAEELAYWLTAGALAGGLLQLLIPAGALWKEGWRPAWDWTLSPAMATVQRLFFPALLGAAVSQVNILVSRLAAFTVDTEALAALYFANRLVELPLGLFAIAITTVAFPALSRAAKAQDEVTVPTESVNRSGVLTSADTAKAAFPAARREGLRLMAFLVLPAVAGLWLLAEPIVATLFGWGRFGSSEVAATFPLLQAFALAMPAYALSAFEVRVCHARRAMKVPLRWALATLALNLVLVLWWAPIGGALGLAWANVASAWLQAIGLTVSNGRIHGIRGDLGRILAATTLMGVAVVGVLWLFQGASPELADAIAPVGSRAWGVVATSIPVGMVIYGAAAHALGLPMGRLLNLQRKSRSGTPPLPR